MNAKEFYSVDWVAESLVAQFRNRYVNIRFPFGMRRHYSEEEIKLISKNASTRRKGLAENPFFEIHQVNGRSNPLALDYFVSKGAVEFIPEVSLVYDIDRTDLLIIDLDPKDDSTSFDDLRGFTYKVLMQFLNAPVVEANPRVMLYKVRFSGNRSFHLYFKLDRLYVFPPLRVWVKEVLDPLCAEEKKLNYKNVRDKHDYVLVDIGAIARHRCVRSLWSLHHKTGLACIPVQDIFTFDRAEASVEKVLERGCVKEVF